MYVGCIYITGNIQTYCESYFKTSATNVSLMLPTIYFLNAFCLVLFGKYTQRNVQPKFMILVGGFCGISGLLVATSMQTYWSFFPFYCISWGLLTGCSYLTGFHHLWLWFPQSPGLSSGIVMGGYGIGALIFDNIMTPIMNPDNIPFQNPCNPDANYGCYPDSVNANFKRMMHTLTTLFAALVLIGIVFVFQGPLKQNNLKELETSITSQTVV